VGRQWRGRLGEQADCRRGIFLAYAAARGYAPLDRRLYLPKDWAGDAARRAKCHVPGGVEFREGWRIAAELIERSGPGLPHAWVVGFRRVDAWAGAQAAGRWTRLTIRAGEKGPLRVDAMAVRVRTRLKLRPGPEGRLVVMRMVAAEPETHHA
jgi:hypothetical protein